MSLKKGRVFMTASRDATVLQPSRRQRLEPLALGRVRAQPLASRPPADT